MFLCMSLVSLMVKNLILPDLEYAYKVHGIIRKASFHGAHRID